MKAMIWMMGFLLAGALAVQADDLVIQSFDTSGRVTFNEVPNALGYRVEWASAAGGAWTNSWDSLNGIPAAARGVVTAAVPMLYRVVACLTVPPGMVLIPGGNFVMGATTNMGHESAADEIPQHTVNISTFYMDKYEVTKALWDEVYAWAATNGYTFAQAGSGKAPNHPAHTVNWYDMVKWCNARSEKERLTLCYTTNGVIYKTGNNNNVACNWSANGYRLPTEAEWEKAARGGVADTRFPWADYTNKISHAKANYQGHSPTYSYDLSNGFHPTYFTGGLPYSSPVGVFAPNGYGLYDMAGGVWEWVWDWYNGSYYGVSAGPNPRGPNSGSFRVARGGTWGDDADDARCAGRNNDYTPGSAVSLGGFRCARGL